MPGPYGVQSPTPAVRKTEIRPREFRWREIPKAAALAADRGLGQSDDVVGADRHPRQLAAGRVAERGNDRCGGHDRRRLADALDAVGRVRLGLLDELRRDRRHVEESREEVVREVGIEDHPVAYLDLLHEREPETLRGASLDLALDRERVERVPDVLRRPDPDDAREPELDVHLDDDPHRRDGEGDVRAIAEHLAGFGVERVRLRMAIDALDVDLSEPASLTLGEGVATRELHRAGGHPRHA